MGWVASNNLIIPETEFEDHKKELMKSFMDRIEDVVNANQKKDRPYFILFRGVFDRFRPQVMRSALKVSDTLPMYITGSTVFWVSNKRGICEWLWTVDDKGKIKFNKDGVAYLKAKGALDKVA